MVARAPEVPGPRGLAAGRLTRADLGGVPGPQGRSSCFVAHPWCLRQTNGGGQRPRGPGGWGLFHGRGSTNQRGRFGGETGRAGGPKGGRGRPFRTAPRGEPLAAQGGVGPRPEGLWQGWSALAPRTFSGIFTPGPGAGETASGRGAAANPRWAGRRGVLPNGGPKGAGWGWERSYARRSRLSPGVSRAQKKPKRRSRTARARVVRPRAGGHQHRSNGGLVQGGTGNRRRREKGGPPARGQGGPAGRPGGTGPEKQSKPVRGPGFAYNRHVHKKNK